MNRCGCPIDELVTDGYGCILESWFLSTYHVGCTSKKCNRFCTELYKRRKFSLCVLSADDSWGTIFVCVWGVGPRWSEEQVSTAGELMVSLKILIKVVSGPEVIGRLCGCQQAVREYLSWFFPPKMIHSRPGSINGSGTFTWTQASTEFPWTSALPALSWTLPSTYSSNDLFNLA